MTLRLDPSKQSPAIFKKMVEFSMAVKHGSIEHAILHLVDIRASQLNGCAYCLDMHVKEARIGGERELRIHHVAVWHESPLFSARERAALAWTEELTKLPAGGISDEAFAAVREAFSEQEVADLTFQIMVINAWNRQSIAYAFVPGSTDKLYGLDKANLS
ncbi:AhpD family alkylhydroperoxidase [Sphingomonas zeicaulis]|uniref:carboxymuconolactone decarboxylase family protein n=1 Tax=Sphingomonas zeicaulis TaxID=1632740 RepID=UPI003D220846